MARPRGQEADGHSTSRLETGGRGDLLDRQRRAVASAGHERERRDSHRVRRRRLYICELVVEIQFLPLEFAQLMKGEYIDSFDVTQPRGKVGNLGVAFVWRTRYC